MAKKVNCAGAGLRFLSISSNFGYRQHWDGEMKSLLATVIVATATTTAAPPAAPPTPDNWCKVGHTVMVPDGREGPVTSLDGDFCQVLVYGDTYASQWVYFSIEPVYPQELDSREFGH